MTRELARRFASGLPLAIVLAAAILFSPPWLMFCIMGIFLCAAGWEWGGLTGRGHLHGVVSVAIGLTLALVLIRVAPWMRLLLLALAALLWLGIALRLNRIEKRGHLSGKPPRMMHFAAGVLMIVLAGVGADTLLLVAPASLEWTLPPAAAPLAALAGGADQLFGRMVLIAVLTLAAVADIGAYFAGKAWGRQKIAPLISPGKTVEGLAGGLVAAVALAAVILLPLSVLHWHYLMLVAVEVVLLGLVGDLWESLRKRYSQVKDSGNLLAGHGGMLDRIDSHLAALPVSAVALHMLAIKQASIALPPILTVAL